VVRARLLPNKSLPPDLVPLSDPAGALRIEYSGSAVERIRLRAREGLMAAPRVGMGVGGVLLGEREGDVIRVLDAGDIPCAHSAGPSFQLTQEEKDATKKLIVGEAALRVIGFYCSKTRGEPVMSEADLDFYRTVFGGPDLIALVVRP